jgi:hypothetical protein
MTSTRIGMIRSSWLGALLADLAEAIRMPVEMVAEIAIRYGADRFEDAIWLHVATLRKSRNHGSHSGTGAIESTRPIQPQEEHS